MSQTMIPAKAALRSVLLRRAARMGLTTAAVDLLVERAELSWLRSGAEVVGGADAVTAVVVCGAVKVRWRGAADGPAVAVQIAGPGDFLGAGVAEPPRAFHAVTVSPAVVAAFTRTDVRDAFALLPVDRRLRLAAYTWRAFSRHVADAAEALAVSLEVRVMGVLRRLARTFGAPHLGGGTEIRLRLRTTDLAELAMATRPNVSRCLAAARRAGRLRVEDGMWILDDGASPPPEPAAERKTS